MLRFCVTAAAALLLTACGSKPQDVTATYTVAGGGANVVVKAAGNGDARIDSGNQTLLRHDGTEYMINREGGQVMAVSVPDFLAVMGDMFRESGNKPMGLGEQLDYTTTKQGTETIAGLTGDVWKVAPKSTPAATAADAVISEDKSLKHVGDALAMQTRIGVASMEQVQGGRGNLEKAVLELMSKGMVLRFGPVLKLEKVERGTISADEFKLPEKLLTKAELKTRLTEARDRARAAAGTGADPVPVPAPKASPSAAPAPAPKK